MRVEDQQVAGALDFAGQGGRPVAHRGDLIAGLAQVELDEVADIRLVFGNEKSGRHGIRVGIGANCLRRLCGRAAIPHTPSTA